MRKFDKDSVAGLAAPDLGGNVVRLNRPVSLGRLAAKQAEELRSLVRFAIGQGYYDAWNKSQEPGVNLGPKALWE